MLLGSVPRSCLLLAAGLAILLSSAFLPAEAKVIVKEKTRFYFVSGKTGLLIYRDMAGKGRRNAGFGRHDFVASTTISFVPRNLKGAVVGRKCVIRDLDVVMTATIIMPKWKRSKTASRALASAWDRFYDNVWAHEKEHERIGREEAAEMIRVLTRLSDTSRNCSGLAGMVGAPIKRVMAKYNARQDAFDASPYGHGGQNFKLDYVLQAAK